MEWLLAQPYWHAIPFRNPQTPEELARRNVPAGTSVVPGELPAIWKLLAFLTEPHRQNPRNPSRQRRANSAVFPVNSLTHSIPP